MMNHAVLDQRINDRVHGLGGDSKTRAREDACIRDKKGVDADQLTMRIDQGTAGVTGVNGSVGLNEIRQACADRP